MNVIAIKNLIIHLLLIFFYIFWVKEVSSIDESQLETLVLFVGLIVIAPITSNFIYSYSSAKTEKAKTYGHLTTFFSMLVIWMLFVILDILLLQMIGNIFVFRISILLFWFAVIFFDFADWGTENIWLIRGKGRRLLMYLVG